MYDTFSRRRTLIGFLICGLINSLPYSLVLSAAKNLAQHFHHEDFIGLILFCNVGSAIFVRIVNTFYLNGFKYSSRIYFNCLVLSFGLIGMFFIEYLNFWFMLLCVVLMGSVSSLGESVMLCFLKQYPSDLMLVSGWSSGTGFSGVLGSSLYLVCVFFEIPNNVIFFSLLPAVLIYLLSFRFIISPPPAYVRDGFVYYKNTYLLGDADPRRRIEHHVDFISHTGLKDISLPSEAATEPTVAVHLEDKPLISKADSGLSKFIRVWKMVRYYALNLCFVYISEYVIITSLASKAVDDTTPGYVYEHFYELVQFCYQITVLISRSSLPIVQIHRIGLLTIFQLVNFAVFLLQTYLRFIPVYMLLVIALWTGLLGGSSYINTFHLLYSNKTMPQSDREYAVNIVALHISIGITSSAIIDLGLDWLYKRLV
ncbi:hypothetical protein RCL1_000699 [Eukaryota sp. TZLM3-RCL]